MKYIPNIISVNGEIIQHKPSEEAILAHIIKEDDSEDTCVFMLPKSIFDKLFHPAETHVERMWVEREQLRQRIGRLSYFLESDTYKDMNLIQQKIIQYQLSAMREYEHYLNLRYESERMNPSFNI